MNDPQLRLKISQKSSDDNILIENSSTKNKLQTKFQNNIEFRSIWAKTRSWKRLQVGKDSVMELCKCSDIKSVSGFGCSSSQYENKQKLIQFRVEKRKA